MSTKYQLIVGDTPVSGLIDINLSVGRRSLLDVTAASTGTCRFRRTTANSAVLDSFAPGLEVTIDYSRVGDSGDLAIMEVSDVQLEYGNPTPGGAYNDDYVTVTVEGVLAKWGRANIKLDLAEQPLLDQLSEVTNQTGLTIIEDFSNFNDPTLAAYSFGGSANEYLQLLQQTTNCRYIDYQEMPSLEIKSAYEFTPATYNFTDSTGSATVQTYQEANLDSLAMNYYTQVQIQRPNASIPNAATATGATEPYRVLQQSTLWSTALEAKGYAEYLLDLYEDPVQRVGSVTCLSEAQSTDNLAKLATTCIGKKFSIVLRGTTLYGICEGFDMTASPGSSSFTFYFSNAAQDIAWFILNDADQGVLDQNRLGF